MNFERKSDPIKTLNIGWDRKLKKGDEFILVVPAIMGSYGMNPQREERAIATEDETSHKHRYLEKKGRNGEADEWDWYEVRQVRFEIPNVAMGWAEMRDNCEFPRWTFTTNPEFKFF